MKKRLLALTLALTLLPMAALADLDTGADDADPEGVDIQEEWESSITVEGDAEDGDLEDDAIIEDIAVENDSDSETSIEVEDRTEAVVEHFASDVPGDAYYAGAAELMVLSGMMEVDEAGRFNPTGHMTRADAAILVCRLLEVGAADGNSIFPDAVGHTAEGYIVRATQMGIVNGNGAGLFQPDDDVTYEQMVKMMVCAAGADEQARAAGGWAGGYLSVGNDLGITHDITFHAADPATRQDISMLADNLVFFLHFS